MPISGMADDSKCAPMFFHFSYKLMTYQYKVSHLPEFYTLPWADRDLLGIRTYRQADWSTLATYDPMNWQVAIILGTSPTLLVDLAVRWVKAGVTLLPEVLGYLVTFLVTVLLRVSGPSRVVPPASWSIME